MDPAEILERILERPLVALVMRVLDVYGRAAGGLLANGLAFAALFATFPLVLLILGIAGLIVVDPEAQERLADALKTLVPPLADFVDQGMAALRTNATVASVLGFIGVVWAVSQLYVTLDVAFSRIFAKHQERDVVRRTLRGFLWVLILISVVVGTILLGVISTAIGTLFPNEPASIGALRSILGGWPFLLALGIGLVFVIYRTLPPGTPSVRAIWLPAVVAGIVIVALSQLFLVLAPLLVGAARLAGSLATAFIALAWLSFTFQALLYGAAWVRVREEGSLPKAPIASAPDDPSAGGSALAAPAAPAEPGIGRE
jgi:YihY family inner membrane protein